VEATDHVDECVARAYEADVGEAFDPSVLGRSTETPVIVLEPRDGTA
jgi:hypothetical protein